MTPDYREKARAVIRQCTAKGLPGDVTIIAAAMKEVAEEAVKRDAHADVMIKARTKSLVDRLVKSALMWYEDWKTAQDRAEAAESQLAEVRKELETANLRLLNYERDAVRAVNRYVQAEAELAAVTRERDNMREGAIHFSGRVESLDQAHARAMKSADEWAAKCLALEKTVAAQRKLIDQEQSE